MKSAPKPLNEYQRLLALDSYEVLDTIEEQVFDQLTLLAAQICGTSISLISLVDKDRQWFKSHHGLNAKETPRELAFCAHSVYSQSPLIVNDARTDERFFDNPLVTNDPNVIFYAGVPLIDSEGYVLGTLCVIDHEPKVLSSMQLESLRILSEQVIAQLTLRRAQTERKKYLNQIEQLAAQAPGVIYQYQLYKDGRSCFPFASKAMQDIYEVSPDEVRRDADIVFSRLFPDDLQKVSESIALSAKNLTTWNMDYRVKLPTKGLRWLRGFARPQKQEDESILWHGFITDVTEEKAFQMQLHLNAKMAALGEMASGIAHEINNPLTVIVGKAAIIKRNLENNLIDPEKLIQEISRIEKTSHRIAKIIKGLKDFSRNAENDPHIEVNLDVIFENVAELVQEKFKNNQIDLKFKNEKDLLVTCNSTQIEQVIMNLLGNSFDAVKNFEEKWVLVHTSFTDNLIKILVTDSGLGIPAEIAEKIMNPFYTTKTVGEGTGLGLSLSKGLIESHHGRLFYDKDATNTTFVIELPRTKEK